MISVRNIPSQSRWWWCTDAVRLLSVDVCRALNPPVYPISEYVDPNPAYDPKKAVHLLDFNVSKAERVLGIGLVPDEKKGVDAYVSIEKLTRDMLEDFKARGW